MQEGQDPRFLCRHFWNDDMVRFERIEAESCKGVGRRLYIQFESKIAFVKVSRYKHDHTNLLANNDFVDVIKFIPILVEIVHVTVERLKLWTARYSKVKSLGGEKRLLIEQIISIGIRMVRQKCSA